MIALALIDEALLCRMRSAGITRIDFGVETLTEGSLRSIKPMQDSAKIRNVLRSADKTGILIRALMMIGYPWETRQSLAETRSRLLDLPIDQLRLCFYVPFVGTKIYKDLKDRIIVSCEDLTTEKPVVECKGVSSEDLQIELAETIKAFYNSKQYLEHVRAKLEKYPEYQTTFKKFFKYLYREKTIESLSSSLKDII